MHNFVSDWKSLVRIANTNPEQLVDLHLPPREYGPVRKTASQARAHMLACLHNKINSHLPAPAGRKHHEDYWYELQRDMANLRHIQHDRIRIYQWQTQLFRDRFSHLLSNYND